jgi:hypothetical protein
MNNSTPRGFALVVVVATAAALSGCRAYGPAANTPVGPPQNALQDHPQTRPALLYVSDDEKDDVLVYSYPSLKVVRTLPNIKSPAGLCVDPKDGSVWVTVSSDFVSQIVEFSHGGTKPIRTLQDSRGEDIVGCAVSPTSGDVAVSNATFGGDDPGDVVVYNLHTGKSKTYHDKQMLYFGSLGYDTGGNLFVDGRPSSYNSTFRLDELPDGGNKLVNIRWRGPTIRDPGNVQYDGTSVTVGDTDKALIYQIAGGKVVGTTVLAGACYVDQYFIDGGSVVVPSNCYKTGTVSLYRYPAGGAPIATIGGFGIPVGAVISR